MFTIERLAEHPEEIYWRVYFFFDGHEVLVGSGGFQGRPIKSRPTSTNTLVRKSMSTPSPLMPRPTRRFTPQTLMG